MTQSQPSQGPLAGTRVLDLTRILAGPLCAQMLGDMGAEVLKVEPPGAGDLARVWGAPVPGPDFSYFVTIHRNKRSIVVDLKKPEGKALFFKLVEKADVVIENFRVGALKRLGNMNHIGAALPLRAGGVDVKQVKAVVFNTVAESVTAVVGGHIDIVAATPSTILQQVQRLSLLPEYILKQPSCSEKTWQNRLISAVFGAQ